MAARCLRILVQVALCCAHMAAAGMEPCKTAADCPQEYRKYDCEAVPRNVHGAGKYCVIANISSLLHPVKGGWESECETDADCKTGGVCASRTDSISCGGAPPPPGNACVYDQCTLGESEHGCPQTYQKLNQTCVQAGAFREIKASCKTFTCTRHSDCLADKGGKCTVFPDQCGFTKGFFCTYDSSECRSDADCKSKHKQMFGAQCFYDVTKGKTGCKSWIPPPAPAPAIASALEIV